VKIIVGVDGSPTAREALAFALEEGRLRRRRVCAVYAWNAPADTVPSGQLFGGQVFDTSAGDVGDLQALAEQRLAELVAEVADGAEIEQRAVSGHAAEVLVDLAQEGDLLVVGSRGHSALAATLLGSVSQACTLHARCPVVVVRGVSRTTDWQIADVIAREAARNSETWAALSRLGVTEGCALALDFVYESAGADADAALAAHLHECTDYVVVIEETGVSGRTQPMALSPDVLDVWVQEMVGRGHEHGGCMFDGWTATVDQKTAATAAANADPAAVAE
jgi:nucleotide-binding universal stress UspA family protein